MSDNYAQDAVTITRAEYDALIAGIKRIGERELTERLTLESENPDLGALQGEINGLVDQLDAHLAEDRDATMNLALAMSECFAVLDGVRAGDLGARVSDETIASSDELMSQFARTLNETVEVTVESVPGPDPR